MKVRMCVSIAGHADPSYSLPEFSFSPGDEPDLDPALAKAWIASGLAEKIGTRRASAAPVDGQKEAPAEESQKESE